MADNAAKTSDHFVNVDPEYAVYTNDVDKPYPVTEEKADDDQGHAATESDEDDKPKPAARRTSK